MTRGTRVSKTRQGEASEDVSHPVFSIEVKHGKQIPKFVTGAWEQAKRNAPEGKVPLAVFHPPHGRMYALLLLEDLMEVMGEDDESEDQATS